MSTGGGMSFMGGRSDFDPYEPPFLVLPDQESLNHFITKQRKMVSSVSSKYLNYPNKNETEVSTINGDSATKIGNFNEY